MKSTPTYTIALLACLYAIVGFSSSSHAGNLYALLHIDETVSAWSDPDLTAKLLDRLSGYRSVDFEVVADSNWATSASHSNYVSSDYLTRIANEHRARYIIVIENLEETLETRKGLSIPLLLSRYKQVAVITGTLRIIDSDKGRMVYNNDFEITSKSRSRWEALEDNPNVAGLRTDASEKQKLFTKLEWKAADELATRILKVMKLK